MDCRGRTRWPMLVDQLKEDQIMLAFTFLITAVVLFVIAAAGKKGEWDAESFYKANLGFSCLYGLAFLGELIFF